MTRAAVAVALLVMAVGVPWPARAEHEVYYRYTVLGYVRDARGRPLPGHDVTLIRDKTGFSYLGETDASGLYVITARLGDESAGEPLTVRTGGATVRITVRFAAANHRDERGTRVDFDGARVTERAAWFSSTLARFLGTASR